MAGQYFARINEDNKVLEVVVVDREYMLSRPERYPGTWVETFRLHPSKNFAYPGVTYDPVTEDFVYPEVVAPPLPSNTEAGTWYESEQIFNNPSTGE
jgi:hypothetical protein